MKAKNKQKLEDNGNNQKATLCLEIKIIQLTLKM